ncbi:hypothetical protein IAR50_002869 [Cryptococcus sp. DSM 104548]
MSSGNFDYPDALSGGFFTLPYSLPIHPASSTEDLSNQAVAAPSHEEARDGLFIDGVQVSLAEFFNHGFGMLLAAEAGETFNPAGSPAFDFSACPIALSPPATPALATSSTIIPTTPTTPTKQVASGRKRASKPSSKSPAKAPTPANLKRDGVKRTQKHTRCSMACECCRVAKKPCNVQDIYRCDRCTSKGKECKFWLTGRGTLKVKPRAIELGLEIINEDGEEIVIAPERGEVTVQAGPSEPASAPAASASLEMSSDDVFSANTPSTLSPSQSTPDLSCALTAASSQWSLSLPTPSSPMPERLVPATTYLAAYEQPTEPSMDFGFDDWFSMPGFDAQPAQAQSHLATPPATERKTIAPLPAVPASPSPSPAPAPAMLGSTLGMGLPMEDCTWDLPAASSEPVALLFSADEAMADNSLGLEGMMNFGMSGEAESDISTGTNSWWRRY